MKTKTFLSIFFAIVLLCGFSYGDSFVISSEALKEAGIDYEIFHPINLSHTGNYFVGCERIKDLKTRASGISRVLRVIYFENKKIKKVDSIQLPITQWVNAAVSDTKNEVCIVGNHGTKILRVNLDTKEVETIWEHQPSKEGFKSGPFLLCYNGSFFTTGWFYDANQIWKGDFLVKLVIKETTEKNKKKSITTQFVQQINLDQLMNQPEGFTKAYYYVSGDTVFFNMVKPKDKRTYLMHYRKGKISPVDNGYLLSIFVGCETKVFYSVFYEENPPVIQHFVKDLKTGKTWKIGKDKDPFTYPFLSRKGDRLIVCTLNNKNLTQSAYVGDEKNDYRLQKFIHNMPIGPMKLSYDGNVYLFMIPDGLQIGTFSKK